MAGLLQKFETGINQTGIIGDIGGTNARFAFVTPKGVMHEKRYKCSEFSSFYSVLETYIDSLDSKVKPIAISLGVAGPDDKNEIRMSYLPWDVSGKELKKRFGFRRIQLMNDFVAVALSIRHLNKDSDYVQIGDGFVQDGNIGVIGPGTGLGFTKITPKKLCDETDAQEVEALDMFHTDDRYEQEISDIIRTGFDRPLKNDLITGRGLLVIYNAVCINSGLVAQYKKPEQITAGVKEGNEEARRAFETFSSFLGRAAGNFAALNMTKGGIYIAGGIVPAMLSEFKSCSSRFIGAFENNGIRAMTSKIPTFVITEPLPAFIGLRSAISSHLKKQL